MRLEGPMQSWGGPVAGNDRPSLDVPTRSGVMGLVASALGIERSDVERLARLHADYAVAIRVDRRGTPGVDYHTTLDVPTADGKIRADAVISKRRYLYDASFTALLVQRRAAAEPIEAVARALRRPRFSPYLGRRACPPSVPVMGEPSIIEAEDWRRAFEQVPVSERHDAPPLDIHLDAELAPEATHRARRQRDVLIGRLPRLFGEREVHVVRWTPQPQSPMSPLPATEGSIDRWFR
jgi:CRISPR system Cascade subunit CasD